jgi:hypothetical protein
MDQIGAGGTDITTLFNAMRTADTIFVQVKNDAAQWVRYQLTAPPTINSGWAQVPVSLISSGGTIAGSQLCVMQLTLTAGGGGGAGGLATDPLANVKGDVFAASGNDAVGRLALGTDGHVLTADSTQTLGVKWAAGGGGGSGISQTDADARYVALAGATMSGGLTTPALTVAATTTVTARVYGAGSPALSPTFVSVGTNEYGVRFRSTADATLTHVRWYRAAPAATPSAARLWDTTTGLAVYTLSAGELTPWAVAGDGWKVATLTTPFVLVPGRDYIVSLTHPPSANVGYQTVTPVPDTPLVFVGHTTSGGTPGAYPSAANTVYALLDAVTSAQPPTAPGAAAGEVRLKNTATVGWRNAANTADLSLTMDGSDAGPGRGRGTTTTAPAPGAGRLPATPAGTTVVINGVSRRLVLY